MLAGVGMEKVSAVRIFNRDKGLAERERKSIHLKADPCFVRRRLPRAPSTTLRVVPLPRERGRIYALGRRFLFL